MPPDKTIAQRLAELPPAKRAALQVLLRQRAGRANELQPRREGTPVPLAYGQRRLWVLEQFNPGVAAYNETNSLRLNFPLEVEVFRRAVNEIVRRHECLRMKVRVVDGQPFMDISSTLSFDIPLNDLRHLPPHEREAEALRFAAEQARVPMDLSAGPLLRATLYRLDANDILFVMTMHHMICDGWSMGLFMVELLTLYWSFVAGRPSPLPDLKIQYGDYAVWQQRRLARSVADTHLAYWREQLKDLPTLALPTDRPRPAEFTFRGARHSIEITGSTYERLTGMAARYNVTLSTVLLTVFAILLHRYTEQEDIIIGTPVSGRSRRELESIIGFFVNTLVLRLAVDGRATCQEVLEHIHETSVAGYAHQEVPFERLVEELKPRRDGSRNPLFQVMFQLFQRPSAAGLNKEILLPFSPVDTGISKVDLSMEFIWAEDSIKGFVEYNTDLFDAGRICRMITHFARILEAFLSNPSIRVSELDMLAPEEKKQLHEWNQTAVPYPRDRTIPQLFREQVEQTPHAVALRSGTRTLTYSELLQHAEALASELAKHGIKRGDFVGLYLDRGLELPVAVIGILETGAGYVPLDPEYPADRIEYMVRDSRVKAVVATQARAEEAAAFGVPVISIQETLANQRRVRRLTGARSATDVAYVMYTSGTTGRPKGVVVTHRNVLRLVKNVRYVQCDTEQTLLQFSPISFDASTFELWGCLLNGGTLAIFPSGVPSLEELGTFIKAEKVSLLFLTTALFRQMIERCAADLRGVRQVITGGEEMPVSQAKAAWKALPRSRLLNAYGPTECTTYASMYVVGAPETIGERVPIGKPIENTTAYVLDRYGNLMPVGVPGELCLGGDGVAEGYWDRPELTSERFVPDVFRGAGRLYRTGDVAAYREDGNILFYGRRDRQVKVSGFRIELAELEAAIQTHPDVTAAAAVAVGVEDKRLRVFCELVPGKALSLPELRTHLARLVPHFMLPSQLDIVQQLPLTPNGKIDIDALLRLEPMPSGRVDGFVSPRNRTEQTLSEIWSELLELDRVGVTENFFELGGQSLVATRVLSRVRSTFGTQITMREFFDAPTIEHLATIVSAD